MVQFMNICLVGYSTCRRSTVVTVVLLLVTMLCIKPVHSGKWYMFRMLRNAGLSSVNALDQDDCVNQCLVTSGCSAISYQPPTGACLLSMCNNLDLYKTTGWHTYVIITMFIEGRDFRAVQIEWMLTDTCAYNNQGVLPGPTMNLYSITYSKPLSAFSGKAATFSGIVASRGKSDSDSNLNNPMGSQSMTFMVWVNWAIVDIMPLLEFYSGSDRKVHFWYYDGGLYYNLNLGTSGCVSNCALTYSFTPTVNWWYHVAFVYDGSIGVTKVFLNSSLVANKQTGVITHNTIWDKAYIAVSTYTGNSMLTGSMCCMKLLMFAASQAEIAALSNSCSVGKMRFSG